MHRDLREIGGELAEIRRVSVGRTHYAGSAFGAQRCQVLPERQLQRGVFGQLHKGVDVSGRRGRDGAVETHGIAQIPEPVLVDGHLRADCGPECCSDAINFGDRELTGVQVFSQCMANLSADGGDHAGMCRIADGDHAREHTVLGEVLDDLVNRLALAGDAHHRRRVDDRKLGPARIPGKKLFAGIAVGRDDRHRVVIGGELVGDSGPGADNGHRVVEGHDARDVGPGDLALAVPDDCPRGYAHRAPQRRQPHHLGEEGRLNDSRTVIRGQLIVEQIAQR